jgi:hypothetical protein
VMFSNERKWRAIAQRLKPKKGTPTRFVCVFCLYPPPPPLSFFIAFLGVFGKGSKKCAYTVHVIHGPRLPYRTWQDMGITGGSLNTTRRAVLLPL